ncbi:MAG: SIMPL domain-containing protein, partial [Gaiellaceae bacterium]
MKRLLFLAAAGLAVVALAGAVGLPDLAGAQDPAADEDTVTASGVGTATAVPNEAQMSFGVESRAPTAKAAVAANADAMRQVINALRRAGAREIATQWVSVYPVSRDDGGIDGYSASNSVSAVSDVDDAAGLIDAAAEAGA